MSPRWARNSWRTSEPINVARDLDTIREALGDSKLTFLGYSYGTRIGAAYAEAFPKNVRAMILDGAIDPNADPVESDLRQAKGFQDAFDDYAKDCAKSPTCPLGTDPAKAVDVYHHLVYPLVDKNNPMIGKPARTKDPRGLSYSDAIIGTIMALYSPNFWHHLTYRVDRAGRPPWRHAAGVGRPLYAARQTRPLQQLHRRPGGGQLCGPAAGQGSGQGHRRGPPLARGRAVHELREIHRRRPAGHVRVLAGSADQLSRTPSRRPAWRRRWWYPPPMTPLRRIKAGVDLANELHGGLLTFDGTQHTVVFQGNSCIDDYATAYIVSGTVPSKGAKC